MSVAAATTALMAASSSRMSGVENCVSWSARSAAHSAPGVVRPAATIARQARAEAAARAFGACANGIP